MKFQSVSKAAVTMNHTNSRAEYDRMECGSAKASLIKSSQFGCYYFWTHCWTYRTRLKRLYVLQTITM